MMETASELPRVAGWRTYRMLVSIIRAIKLVMLFGRAFDSPINSKGKGAK
jgi:hypothetical protein